MSQQPPSFVHVGSELPPVTQQPPVMQQPASPAEPQVFWKAGPDGQPQVFFGSTAPPAPVQPLMQPQASSYMPVQPPVQSVTGPLPPAVHPYSFLVFSLFSLAVFGLLNVTTLILSIPAVILSMTSENRKSKQDYAGARRAGVAALVLNVLILCYMFVCVLVAVILPLKLLRDYCSDNPVDCARNYD